MSSTGVIHFLFLNVCVCVYMSCVHYVECVVIFRHKTCWPRQFTHSGHYAGTRTLHHQPWGCIYVINPRQNITPSFMYILNRCFLGRVMGEKSIPGIEYRNQVSKWVGHLPDMLIIKTGIDTVLPPSPTPLQRIYSTTLLILARN